MILECDSGNTRCKWRLVNKQGVSLDEGAFVQPMLTEAIPLTQRLSGKCIERCKVACMRGSCGEQQWLQWAREALGIAPEFARSGDQCMGVTNGYRHPEQLGVDRWLAMVAAYVQHRSAVLVIDIGTALTVDVVNDQGRHLGGYIMPGTTLMKRILQSDTANVRFDNLSSEPTTNFGHSTNEAVCSGVWIAVVGAVRHAIDRAADVLSRDFAIVLTGGMAQQLKVYLSIDGFVQPQLVLDGLQYVL